MGQAQINVRTRACSRTSIVRTKQAALTHNVRGKELKAKICQFGFSGQISVSQLNFLLAINDCRVVLDSGCEYIGVHF